MQDDNSRPTDLQSIPHKTKREITFKDFSKLIAKRRRSVDDLVDLFRGKLDDSRNFFERVMSCQWRNLETGRYEDRGDVVIPYRFVIDFYVKEEHYLEDSKKKVTDSRKLAISTREIVEVF